MATVLNAPVSITPEEFLQLPDRDRYELIDGQLVETAMSLEASCIASKLIAALTPYVEQRRLGAVFTSDASYQCFPAAPNRIRRPDISFIAKGRLSLQQYREGHCLIAPDLAVVLISPNDLSDDLDEKLVDYLSAGIGLIWVVSPKGKWVTVRRPDAGGDIFTQNDLLSGESVIPGFEIPIAELFPGENDIL